MLTSGKYQLQCAIKYLRFWVILKGLSNIATDDPVKLRTKRQYQNATFGLMQRHPWPPHNQYLSVVSCTFYSFIKLFPHIFIILLTNVLGDVPVLHVHVVYIERSDHIVDSPLSILEL